MNTEKTVNNSAFKYMLERISILGIIKVCVLLVSVSNMVWMPFYNEAILLLEDQICGFFLFCYILFGLISIFGAFRMDGVGTKKLIFTGVSLAATIGFGAILINIMTYAFYYQSSLKNHAVVATGINFGIFMCSLYGACLFLTVFGPMISKIIYNKNNKNK